MASSGMRYLLISLTAASLPCCYGGRDRAGGDGGAPSAGTPTAPASAAPRASSNARERPLPTVTAPTPTLTALPPSLPAPAPDTLVVVVVGDHDVEDFAHLLASYTGKRILVTPRAQAVLATRRFSLVTTEPVRAEVAVGRMIAAFEAHGARVTRGSQEIVVDAPP